MREERTTLDQHVVAVTTKAEDKMIAISRIMPNIGRPTAVLCATLYNIILYGPSIWKEVLKIRKYENMLTRTHNMERARRTRKGKDSQDVKK